MKFRPLVLVLPLLFVLLQGTSVAQLLSPQKLLEAEPTDTWPTYNGDYSGRRFSPLVQIHSSNVSSLALAWMYRVKLSTPMRGVASPDIKSTPLMVKGILYFTVPDHVFAVDARTGRELWHYDWVDKGGHLVGNRGLGMYGDWLYFMRPTDGSFRWKRAREKSAGGRKSPTRRCSISRPWLRW